MSVFIGYPSFMAYQMMKGKKGNNDGFPSIPGIVARYSAFGLTNEQMAANPVWVDKTGNGHDIQLKNFSWKGMSGVGGYGDENYQTFYKFTLDDYVFIASPPSVEYMNFTFRVTGLQPGNKLTLAFFGTTNTVYGTWDKDGIYTVDADIVEAGKPTYFYNGYGATRGEFTIEILPLYPGALVFDGVDDEIISAKLIQFADKFTIVGDWKFMEDRGDNAGLLKSNQIYIYNATTGMRIYLKQGSKNYPFSCKKINALTSDGWVYDEKWDKYKVYPIGSDIDISSRLFLGFYGSNFTKIALKNLGIYNNQLLSKDDCIKAYNYLQTLKAK